MHARPRTPFVALFTMLMVGGVLPPVLGQTTPKGWTKHEDASGTITLTPKELQAGEVLLVRFYPREALEGATIGAWLGAQLQTRGAPAGSWKGGGNVQPGTANIATANRAFRDEQGREGLLLLTGVSVDGQHARMAALVFNSEAVAARHKAAAVKVIGELMEIEKKAAVAEDRGLKLEQAPPSVKGIRAGGALKPGRYRGNMVTTRDNSVLRAVEVVVFANGEYQYLEGGDRFHESGTYAYSPATGRFNAGEPLSNSTFDPTEDFCIFGLEGDGKAVLYAEEDHGTSVHKTRLRWASEVDRDPPSTVEARKRAAAEEEARYKFVVEPGAGVKSEEIEAVLSAVAYSFDGMNSRTTHQAYLLMKDGRVMDGLPVPPNELDVSKSRSQEPDRWGFWRKRGGMYEFAWPSRPNEYAPPKGVQTVGTSFVRGSTLEGNYKGASSWGMAGGAGGANFWGVRLNSKGRFEKWKRGIAGTGTPAFEGQTSVGTAYDDKGASTVISGPNVGGGTTTKVKDADLHRMGWYELDGFTLTLKFDDGKIVRMPAFISADKKDLWFEGGPLSLEEPEKK